MTVNHLKIATMILIWELLKQINSLNINSVENKFEQLKTQ